MKPQSVLLAFMTIIASFNMPWRLTIQGFLMSDTSAQAQRNQEQNTEALRLSQLGEKQYNQGQFRESIETFERVLVLVRLKGERQIEGETLYKIGLDYESLGQYSQALKYFQQALVIDKKVGDKSQERITLNNIGRAYDSLGQYPQALKYFQQALVIHKQVGNKTGDARTLNNIGLVYSNLRQYPQALNYYQQALAIVKQVGDKAQEGITLNNIGGVYDSLGEYPQALKYFQQALVIAKEVKNKTQEGTTLNNIGAVYNNLKQYSNAEKMLLAAIQVWESLRQGLTDADKISIFDKQAHTYNFLQHALIAQNKTKTALEIAERGRARAFVELLSKRLSSQLTITPPKVQQLQQIAREQNATLIQYSIIYTPIIVHEKEKLRECRLFIWVIPPTGRIIFRWVDLKPLLQQNTSLTQLAPNSPSFVPTVPNSPTLETPNTPEPEQKINTSWNHPETIILLIAIGSSVIGLVIYCGRFILTKKATPNSSSAKIPRTPPQPSPKQGGGEISSPRFGGIEGGQFDFGNRFSKLKQNWLFPSLLILSAVSASGGLIFLMTQSQPIVQKRNFEKSENLAQLVSSIHQDLVTNRGLGIVPKNEKTNPNDRLKQLHTYLIKPIADLLPTNPNDRIIFIPQSSLFLVPFPALQDESGKYLIEKHTILTAPSIQVLELTRKQKQRVGMKGLASLQSQDTLIVGNPKMPSVPPQIGEPPQQLPSLPGAEHEAKVIANLLKTQAITGNQATKTSVVRKMSKARIVHLATHGLLDERRGLDSAIALATDPPSSQEGEKTTSPLLQGELRENNGLLTADEILDLKLNAELVVLSACDTGKGKITGDGVVGLSRSLISAGTPSVLVSLWSVPDAPTAELMTEFYRNWQQNPDKAQALRNAMLTTMKQHPNPRDWAAFTLIGEAK